MLSLRDDDWRALLSYTKGGDADPPVSGPRRFDRSVREGPDGIGGGEGDGCGVDDRESSPSPPPPPCSS